MTSFLLFMLKKLRQVPRQKGQIKTVTLLLGFYFSALLAMVIFTGFFVYTNLSVPTDSVAASSTETHLQDKVILNDEIKKVESSKTGSKTQSKVSQ